MYQDWKNSDEYDPKQSPWDKNGKCNYFMKGKEWEREAFVTIFEKGEKIVQQKMGIRIKGASTRTNPGKSFNLYSREKYGKSTIEAELFDDNYDIKGNLITSYKSISLRCIYEQGRSKDKYGSDLFGNRENLTSGSMKTSILFLNGEYWGLYLMQEKIDNDFIFSNYLIPKNNIAMIKQAEIEEGPQEELNNFQNFFDEYSKKDVNDKTVYENIKNFVDINSMIEFFATGMYISIGDWPRQNEGEWRNIGEKIEGNKFSDGKWRFMIYDLDYTMGSKFAGIGNYDSDNFKFVEKKSEDFPANLFMALLKNNIEFQNKFINVYCDYANDLYAPEKVNNLIKNYKNEYAEIIAYSQLRWWGYSSKLEGFASYKSRYLQALDVINEFFEKRPEYALKHMKEFLNLKSNLVDLNIEIQGKGKIIVNTIIPQFTNGKWNGKYFSRIPIILKAIPDIGYIFFGWKGDIEFTQKEIEIILLENTDIIAIFD